MTVRGRNTATWLQRDFSTENTALFHMEPPLNGNEYVLLLSPYKNRKIMSIYPADCDGMILSDNPLFSTTPVTKNRFAECLMKLDYWIRIGVDL